MLLVKLLGVLFQGNHIYFFLAIVSCHRLPNNWICPPPGSARNKVSPYRNSLAIVTQFFRNI